MFKFKSLIALSVLFFGCAESVQLETLPNAQLESSQDAPEVADGSFELSWQDNTAQVVPDGQLAAEITGKVIHVLDGDTIDILSADKTTIRIGLNGIDAPEKGQPFGNAAKQFLNDSIGGKIVRVVTLGNDRYGRIIGDAYCLDCTSMAPVSTENVSMVMNGLAWHYVKYAPDDQELAGAEKWAREQRLRLWSDRRSIAPWDWRKLSKAERDKLR